MKGDGWRPLAGVDEREVVQGKGKRKGEGDARGSDGEEEVGGKWREAGSHFLGSEVVEGGFDSVVEEGGDIKNNSRATFKLMEKSAAGAEEMFKKSALGGRESFGEFWEKRGFWLDFSEGGHGK